MITYVYLSGLKLMTTYPAHSGMVLGNMLEVPPCDLWQYAYVVMRHFRRALDPTVPRYIQGELFAFS